MPCCYSNKLSLMMMDVGGRGGGWSDDELENQISAWYAGSFINRVKCSACKRTVSRLVSANRRQNSISAGSVKC